MISMRALSVQFFTLTFSKKLEIANSLDLSEEGDTALSDRERFRCVLLRAQERGILDSLEEAIQSHQPEPHDVIFRKSGDFFVTYARKSKIVCVHDSNALEGFVLYDSLGDYLRVLKEQQQDLFHLFDALKGPLLQEQSDSFNQSLGRKILVANTLGLLNEYDKGLSDREIFSLALRRARENDRLGEFQEACAKANL